MNEIIEAIRTLLKDTLGATYQKYYYGEIRVISQIVLPCIEVIPLTSTITNRGTGGMANNEFRVQVNIKNTLKKYLGGKKSDTVLEHVQDLVKKMEDRDSDGNIKSDTVLGVLHDNLQLSNTANINGDWQITYDEIDLGDSYITFASIIFTVRVITTS